MSKTKSRIGFILLALAGLLAITAVWRAERTNDRETGVARASDAPPEKDFELQYSENAEGTARRRERAVPPAAQAAIAQSTIAEGEVPAHLARARFVDEQGTPIAGVELWLVKDPSAVARSGGDGVARLELDASLFAGSPRILDFESRSEGFARDLRRATASPGQELLLGDWRLVPGGGIDGIVVDPEGRGLARVQVACLNERLEEADWESDRLGALEGLWRPAARATTASDGSFLLEGSPAGRIRLVAVTDDRPAARSDHIDVPAGGTARGVEIRMGAPDGGTTIAGIVLDPRGAAVARAPVSITGGGSSYLSAAGEDGRFTWQIGDHEARDVTARDPERRYREATRRGVRPGTKDLVLQLALAPEIELAVRSREGSTIERFAVAMIAEKGAEVLVFLPEGDRPRGLAILGAPAQRFRVEVRANGWMPARLGPFAPESPPARLECRLDPAGGIHGVVDAAGRPVAGATVGLYRAVEKDDTHSGFPLRMRPRAEIETESGEQGEFSLSVEEARDYYLRAEAEGHAPAELGPLALSPASQREERLELGAGGSLEARVRSSEGASVAGKLVAISRGDGRARTERADEHGLAVFPALTPGKWQVALSETEIDPAFGATRFGRKPARGIPTNCRVFEGETTRLDLWLEDEDEDDCVLTGRLVIDGKPAEGWLAGLDQERSEAADPRPFVEPGAFRLAGDEPGSYRLSLRTDGPAVMLVILDPVELHEGSNHWSLELETGTLEGTLGTPGGEDELLFYRWRRGALQCLAPLVPGEEGRFRCTFAPAGRGALVRFDPNRPMEEQEPRVERELTIEAGKSTSVEF